MQFEETFHETNFRLTDLWNIIDLMYCSDITLILTSFVCVVCSAAFNTGAIGAMHRSRRPLQRWVPLRVQ